MNTASRAVWVEVSVCGAILAAWAGSATPAHAQSAPQPTAPACEIHDVVVGTGERADKGKHVVYRWIRGAPGNPLRTPNQEWSGALNDSSCERRAVIGMKVGGRRTAQWVNVGPMLTLTHIELAGVYADEAALNRATRKELKKFDLALGRGPEAKAGTFLVVRYQRWFGSFGEKFDGKLPPAEQAATASGDVGPAGKAGSAVLEGALGMKVGGRRSVWVPGSSSLVTERIPLPPRIARCVRQRGHRQSVRGASPGCHADADAGWPHRNRLPFHLAGGRRGEQAQGEHRQQDLRDWRR
jgi:hypothetical protein